MYLAYPVMRGISESNHEITLRIFDIFVKLEGTSPYFESPDSTVSGLGSKGHSLVLTKTSSSKAFKSKPLLIKISTD